MIFSNCNTEEEGKDEQMHTHSNTTLNHVWLYIEDDDAMRTGG